MFLGGSFSYRRFPAYEKCGGLSGRESMTKKNIPFASENGPLAPNGNSEIPVTIEDPGAFLLLVSIRLGVDADNPGGDDHF